MAVRTQPFRIRSCGLTDVGLVRENNEDAWAQVLPLRLFVLADGMGGHQAGEVASQEAVAVFCDKFAKAVAAGKGKASLSQLRQDMTLTFEFVNHSVYRMSQTSADWYGMGTTLCSIFFHDKGLIYGHVGDSRIYRLRGGELILLTRDHTLYRELVDAGRIPETPETLYQYKNIITKAIGTEPYVESSVHICDLEFGDIYLMCSDGLTDMLDSDEIKKILQHSISIEQASAELVSNAKQEGGADNITVVLAQVLSPNEK